MIRAAALLAAITMWPLAVSADPSLECSLTSSSQVETGNCLAAVETTTAEALSVVLGFAQDAAQELDDITGRAVTLPALQASQSSWEAWRDTECAYAGALFGGGSGTGIAIRSCRITLTRDRIEALYTRLR
jgi:uncharacterized protein YecT (DUF1311 family)